jgi:hypothetical protein
MFCAAESLGHRHGDISIWFEVQGTRHHVGRFRLHARKSRRQSSPGRNARAHRRDRESNATSGERRFSNGYADEPEDVAENVQLCIDSGVAGLSIEDNTGRADAPLYEKDLAIERIRAARSTIDASETRVVLTGRCEAWLVGDVDPLRTALDRLVAYARPARTASTRPAWRLTKYANRPTIAENQSSHFG